MYPGNWFSSICLYIIMIVLSLWIPMNLGTITHVHDVLLAHLSPTDSQSMSGFIGLLKCKSFSIFRTWDNYKLVSIPTHFEDRITLCSMTKCDFIGFKIDLTSFWSELDVYFTLLIVRRCLPPRQQKMAKVNICRWFYSCDKDLWVYTHANSWSHGIQVGRLNGSPWKQCGDTGTLCLEREWKDVMTWC